MAKKKPLKRAAPRRRTTPSRGREQLSAERLRSAQFRKALTALLGREIRDVARRRVGDVIDAQLARTLLHELQARLIEPATAAELAVVTNRRMRSRLANEQRSLLDVLDRRLVTELGDALETALQLPTGIESIATTLVREEFARRLFTDLIYTAIVSFNERVNPLFGGLAARALGGQIRAFIDLFMPTLQAQAVAFVAAPGNRRLVFDLARSTARLALQQPVSRYAAVANAAEGRLSDAMTRALLQNVRLMRLLREATLMLWDEIYDAIRNRRLGDLLPLEAHAEWLAARVVDLIVPVLSRPTVRRFIAAEIGRAPGVPRARRAR